jgi:predicted Fe-Mo cluster-binding NifX family protein
MILLAHTKKGHWKIIMKIAFVTDDGISISSHFGRAGKYLVVQIDNNKESSRELREKMGHQHFSHGEDHHEHGSGQHGFDPASQTRHASMLEAINDCDVVICGGMGQGAYTSIAASGKKIVMVNDLSIDQALNAYSKGELKSSENLVH